jgi:16S rRNA G527 N7-methylase RsmG
VHLFSASAAVGVDTVTSRALAEIANMSQLVSDLSVKPAFAGAQGTAAVFLAHLPLVQIIGPVVQTKH